MGEPNSGTGVIADHATSPPSICENENLLAASQHELSVVSFGPSSVAKTGDGVPLATRNQFCDGNLCSGAPLGVQSFSSDTANACTVSKKAPVRRPWADRLRCCHWCR